MADQGTLPGLRSELEPGEPIFILRARDPLAPHLAALWAALRKGDVASALGIFNDTVADPGHAYHADGKRNDDDPQVAEASEKAIELNNWRKDKGLVAYGLYTVK